MHAGWARLFTGAHRRGGGSRAGCRLLSGAVEGARGEGTLRAGSLLYNGARNSPTSSCFRMSQGRHVGSAAGGAPALLLR